MKAPERLAALQALVAALEDEIKADKIETLAFAEEFDVKSFNTPFGAVAVVNKEPAIGWHADALLAWVRKHHPGEIERTERVRPAFQSALMARFKVIGEAVMDSASGEVVDCAYVTPAGAPYVVWPSSAKQRVAKAEARRYVQDRAAELAESFGRQIEAGP